jgi:hypothetical protein
MLHFRHEQLQTAANDQQQRVESELGEVKQYWNDAKWRYIK